MREATAMYYDKVITTAPERNRRPHKFSASEWGAYVQVVGEVVAQIYTPEEATELIVGTQLPRKDSAAIEQYRIVASNGLEGDALQQIADQIDSFVNEKKLYQIAKTEKHLQRGGLGIKQALADQFTDGFVPKLKPPLTPGDFRQDNTR